MGGEISDTAGREIWFRARRGDAGTGYGLAHWKGGVVVAAWALSLMAAIGASYLILGPHWPALAVGLALALGWTFSFLRLIKAHSDWNG